MAAASLLGVPARVCSAEADLPKHWRPSWPTTEHDVDNNDAMDLPAAESSTASRASTLTRTTPRLAPALLCCTATRTWPAQPRVSSRKSFMVYNKLDCDAPAAKIRSPQLYAICMLLFPLFHELFQQSIARPRVPGSRTSPCTIDAPERACVLCNVQSRLLMVPALSSMMWMIAFHQCRTVLLSHTLTTGGRNALMNLSSTTPTDTMWEWAGPTSKVHPGV